MKVGLNLHYNLPNYTKYPTELIILLSYKTLFLMQYMIDFRSQFELGTSIFTSHEPYNKFFFWVAKCFITELASPYVQSA